MYVDDDIIQYFPLGKCLGGSYKEIKIKVVTTYKSFNTLAANYVVVIIIRMTFSLTYFFSSQ